MFGSALPPPERQQIVESARGESITFPNTLGLLLLLYPTIQKKQCLT